MKIHHCYLPCLQFICNLWHLILGEYRILAFLLLLAIVFQQEDGLTGKQDDGCEIAEGEKSHRDICKTPCIDIDEFENILFVGTERGLGIFAELLPAVLYKRGDMSDWIAARNDWNASTDWY